MISSLCKNLLPASYYAAVSPPKLQNEALPNDSDVGSIIKEANIVSIVSKTDDTFLYYSNDTIRMKHLNFLVDSEEKVAGSGSGDKRENEPQPKKRKTGLSFELHPCVILDDDMEAMFNDTAY